MGVGAPGLGGGPSLPADIRQTETQGFVETTKKFILAMLPPDSLEVIPFTQREYDEVFKYRSEADRPTLYPLMFLRFGGFELDRADEEAWQPLYNEIFESLPDTVKEWLTWEMKKPFEERDPSYVLLNNFLILVAKGAEWLSRVTQPIEPNSAKEQNTLMNIALPFVALRSAISQTESMLETAETWLREVGPNLPEFDSLTNYFNQVGDLVFRLNGLREEIEKGNFSPEIRQQVTELVNDIDKLREQYQTTFGGNEMKILGTSLELLSVVSSALTLMSPSLLLATNVATMGLSTETSDTGIEGSSYHTTINSILDGIFGAIDFGPRDEIDELNELNNALGELKNG